MIGRFSKLGVYQELFRLRDFYITISAAFLALIGFLVDRGTSSPSFAGNDVALETADIASTHDDISKLPWLVRLSRRMLNIIKINIVFGLVFNAAAVKAPGDIPAVKETAQAVAAGNLDEAKRQ